jgi:transposase
LGSLVWIDESGINDNETYDYAWGPIGPRIYDEKKAERKNRLSIIGALNQGKIKAPFVFEGSCNREVFETYVEKVLIQSLCSGQTVILDNASFHKGGRIRELIEQAGCFLLYLPAYSPDFNPIEHYWAAIKSKIRGHLLKVSGDLYRAAELTFQESYSI